MTFYCLSYDRTRRLYANKITELRKSVFSDLAFVQNNMEWFILIYGEDGKIVDRCFMSYAAGNYVYLFHTTTSGKYERTYRSYHPVEKLVSYIVGKDADVDWLEIPTMKGKQVCMTGGMVES